MAPPHPLVSVVVPTHGRPERLATLLAGLGRQTLDPSSFEVIVVDDGSPDAVAPDAPGLALRVLRHPESRGPAAARNTGWRSSYAPLVAFIDDDCVPVPGWLSALVATGGSAGDVIVQGPVEPPPHQRDDVRPLSHRIEVAEPDRLFVSCNIAYARPLLERVGGFDETFPRANGEDVELGARALKAGASPRWAPDARVFHEVRQPSLRELLSHTRGWEHSVRALALHPELRDLLLWRVFWKPSHPRLLLAAAGGASRRPGIAALAALPYLDHYRRLYLGRRRLGVRELPRHLVVDVAELATMLRASLKHRTFML